MSAPADTTTRPGAGASIRRTSPRRGCSGTTRSTSTPSRSTIPSTGSRRRRSSRAGQRKCRTGSGSRSRHGSGSRTRSGCATARTSSRPSPLPRDLRAAFEFRHASWFADETYAALREAGAALCVAESDELATPPVRTADFGYLRLRRLDYDAPALAKWADFARTHPGEVFAYFKHEDEARGPAFAREFLPLVSSQSSRPDQS